MRTTPTQHAKPEQSAIPSEDLPTIACDDDWLDLCDGDRGILRGRLYGPLRAGDEGLVVSTTSWEVMAVSMSGRYDGIERDAGTPVTVIATRCEDGLQATTSDVVVQAEEN